MSDIVSIDPRTGLTRDVLGRETSLEELDAFCALAASAAGELRISSRAWRATMLRSMATALEGERDEIVAVADAETALGSQRLHGELTRSCYQLQLFADVIEEGGYLEATIDHARDTPMGPQPDLRRMLIPTGPVAVFGASNFPLAFSVPGGDTVSALAAGCPVIVKAHESHPATARLCGEILTQAAHKAGAPDGTVTVVYGRAAGAGLVRHRDITAVSFTGSVRGGRALMELIAERREPIPFYGELGSVNPLVVTQDAASQRAQEIGQGLVQSITLGGGQFCTKPGLAFVPTGPEGDELIRHASLTMSEATPVVLLNETISTAFAAGVDELTAREQVRELATSRTIDAGQTHVQAHLMEVDAVHLAQDLVEECFGPLSLVVRYETQSELCSALLNVPPSLTATLHTGFEESVSKEVIESLQARAGRLVFNGYPTGVAVSWAQTHGGGWPASNSLHTSVGPTAIRRFLRPLTWQSAPSDLLPLELREETTSLPRRVDGVLLPQDRQPSS